MNSEQVKQATENFIKSGGKIKKINSVDYTRVQRVRSCCTKYDAYQNLGDWVESSTPNNN